MKYIFSWVSFWHLLVQYFCEQFYFITIFSRGTSHGNFFRQTYGFSIVCQTLGFKTEEDAAEGLSQENYERGFRLSVGTVWVFKAQTFSEEQPRETAWLQKQSMHTRNLRLRFLKTKVIAAERGWVSKILPQGPRQPEGAAWGAEGWEAEFYWLIWALLLG